MYDEIKKRYAEDKIIILGYSLGSGLASHLASTSNAKLLILQAPYYSINDTGRYVVNRSSHPLHMALRPVPISLLNKYNFDNGKYIQQCKMPVVVIHGDADKLVYYGSSLKLKELFKPGDKLITLEGYGHNNFVANVDYQIEMAKLLTN